MVVGSGPGGALAARRLAEAGRSVIVLEAGPIVRPHERRKDAGRTLSRFFWDGGMRTTRGNTVMPSMRAKNLGGGSVWNSAICMRSSDEAHERWLAKTGIDLRNGSLAADYEAVERFMGVRPVDPAIQGRRNELFAQGARAIGLNPLVIERNEAGCKGSGECFTGCPNDAKLSTDKRGIPEVLAAGGKVISSVVVEELITKGTRVRGVVGRVMHPTNGQRTHRVTIHAKAVILSAGAIENPVIIQKSGFRREGIGGNLMFHPGLLVLGVFGEEVLPWAGASQGYHCLDLMDRGIKLESIWAPPSLMAFRFAGFGRELQEKLARYAQMAPFDAWVSGQDSVGRVNHVPGLGTDMTYHFGQGDVDRLVEALATLTEMFFAVGAEEVILGLDSLPPSTGDRKIVEKLRSEKFSITDFTVASNHVFGTMQMGTDPIAHGTDLRGAVFGTDGLYVADTSLLPESPGANPMMPAMALAHRVAGYVDRDL
ncbi:MAG: GMC family oxidoreductase [Deltaproteobacteria bacterium]|nr:GMC family oxidoreductase [Deltaproteobacteria bacterium]